MGKRDPRVDAYIRKVAPFARPLLTEFRDIVHASCPDVEEKIKWSFPHFDYKGMMCSMAAFTQHAAFGFWKGALILGERNRNAMGHFGRIAKRSDLPSKTVLAGYVRKAAALNDQGVKLPRVVKKPAPRTIKVPALIKAALEQDQNAQAGFDALSPSHRREFIEWITEAKNDDTRARRLAQAMAWMAAGQSRNQKYERKARRMRRRAPATLASR